MVKKHDSLILQLEQSNRNMLETLRDIDLWLGSAPRLDQTTINHMRHRIQKAIAWAEKRA